MLVIWDLENGKIKSAYKGDQWLLGVALGH